MFISSFEKQSILSSIKNMEGRILALESQLKGKEPKQSKQRKKHIWSEEERARASNRMREYHARRRAEKTAA